MKLNELCKVAAIDCPYSAEKDEVMSIAADSAHVIRGTLFVCIRGMRIDGHGLIADAVARGARWVLTEEDAFVAPIEGVCYLRTKNTRRALSYLFNAWYGFPCHKLKLIGVTGTNGKTTVTHIIRHILTKSGCRCGMIGTLGCFADEERIESTSQDPNANMTTPDPNELYRVLAQMVERGMEYAVMEISSHALALDKVAPMRFDVGIFTNLTPEHLDFHKTMEAYADAKERLARASACLIVNVDSPYAEQMIDSAEGSVVRCSRRDERVEYYADEIQLLEQSVSYRLCHRGAPHLVRYLSPGAFSVENSMQAIACAEMLGMDADTAIRAVSELSGAKGRMEHVALPRDAGFDVFIDYAHTPDAVRGLLMTARQMRQSNGRVIILFGCGGDRDRSKRSEMGRIASAGADLVILTSDNCRSEDPNSILREILSGVSFETPCTVIADRKQAITETVLNAKHGDLILLAGKGHEEYEIDGTGKHPFSERDLVRAAYVKRIENI